MVRPTDMVRPTGVTILGVLAIVGDAGAIALGLLFMLGSDFIAHRFVGLSGVAVAGVAVFVGIGLLFLLSGVVGLVIAISLLNLANWARIVTMVFAVTGIAAAAVGVLGALAHFLPVLMMRRAIPGVIDTLIIWYLSQPHVKQAFTPQVMPQSPNAPPPSQLPPSPAA